MQEKTFTHITTKKTKRAIINLVREKNLSSTPILYRFKDFILPPNSELIVLIKENL